MYRLGLDPSGPTSVNLGTLKVSPASCMSTIPFMADSVLAKTSGNCSFTVTSVHHRRPSAMIDKRVGVEFTRYGTMR